MVGRWDRMYVMAGGHPRLRADAGKEHRRDRRARQCRSPQEVVYDYLTEGLDRFLFFPIVNYADGDHATVRDMLTDPGTLLGLSDGGAHCGAIIDASVPSFMLPIGGATAAEVLDCRCRNSSRCRPARPPTSSAFTIAAG